MPSTKPITDVIKRSKQLGASIRFNVKDKFEEALENGADINFVNENADVDPAVFSAIIHTNTWAFDKLLKMKEIDVNKYNIDKIVPLCTAAEHGHEEMVQTLLNNGANPRVFCSYTALHSAIEGIGSYTVLENSIWSKELKDLNQEIRQTVADKALKKEAQDYFYQREKYAKKKVTESVPFVTDESELHLYYAGKGNIIGILLSAGTSPFLPTSNTSRSVLSLVQDPAKYASSFRAMDDEELTYLGCEGESNDILKFSMKLRNKSLDEDTFINVIVHYDIRPSRRQILEFIKHTSKEETQWLVESFAKKVEEHTVETKEHLNGRLGVVQQQLSDVKSNQDFLFQPKVERAQYSEWLKTPGHENLEIFNDMIVIGIEDIFTSFKSGSGNKTVLKEGKVGSANKIISMVGEFLKIPTLGIGDTILKWAVGKSLEKVDEIRESNSARQASKLGNADDVKKQSRALAKKITIAFAQPLLNLATSDEAKKQQEQQSSSLKKGFNKAKNMILNSQFISPAEQEALMALAWMDDLISNAPKIAERVKKEGLANVLFSEVVTKTPPSHIKEKWKEVTKKVNGVMTKTGESYHPADMYEFTAVRTEQNEYLVHEKSKPEIFGWRLVTSRKDVEEMKLRQVEVPVNPPSSELLTLKIPQTAPGERVLPFNPYSEGNSLNLPLPNGNSNSNAKLITFSYATKQLPPTPIVKENFPQWNRFAPAKAAYT